MSQVQPRHCRQQSRVDDHHPRKHPLEFLRFVTKQTAPHHRPRTPAERREAEERFFADTATFRAGEVFVDAEGGERNEVNNKRK